MCRIPLSTIPSIRERRTFGQTRVKFLKEHWTVVFGLLDNYMQRANPHSGHTTDELTSSFYVTVTVLHLPRLHIRSGVCTTLTRRHRTGSFGPFIFDHLPVPFDDNHRSNERNIRFLPSRLSYPKGHKATVFGVREGQYNKRKKRVLSWVPNCQITLYTTYQPLTSSPPPCLSFTFTKKWASSHHRPFLPPEPTTLPTFLHDTQNLLQHGPQHLHPLRQLPPLPRPLHLQLPLHLPLRAHPLQVLLWRVPLRNPRLSPRERRLHHPIVWRGGGSKLQSQ